MAEIHWTNYIGMISGIIGVGVASLSLYKTSKIKSLDLRIELKKQIIGVNDRAIELEKMFPVALKSRKNTSAALGTYNSGGMKKWKNEYDTDFARLGELKDILPPKDEKLDAFSENELEKKLIQIHGLSNEIKLLDEKYKKSLDEDSDNGKFLREQAHKRV